MGRMHVDGLAGFGLDPTTQDTSAGKDQRMRTIVIKDSQLKITIERCRRYRLPLACFHPPLAPSLDLSFGTVC